WALQVLPPTQRSKYYFQYSPPFENTDLDEQTFLDLASMASDAKARAILSEMLLNPAKRIMYLNYALQNQANLNTVAFRNLLDVPVSEVLKEGNSSDLRRALEVTTRSEERRVGKECRSREKRERQRESKTRKE